MRRIKQTQIVKRPREQVFGEWTDYESWPRFSVLYRRVSVRDRVGYTVNLDAEVKFRHGHLVGIDHPRGRTASRTERHVLTPPKQVEVKGETQGAISTSVWKFECVPAGTLVTADVYAPVHGPAMVMGTIARGALQSLLRMELQAFAEYVEAKQAGSTHDTRTEDGDEQDAHRAPAGS